MLWVLYLTLVSAVFLHPDNTCLVAAGMQHAARCTTAPQSSSSSFNGSATPSCYATTTPSAQQKPQHGYSTAAAGLRPQLPRALLLPPRSQLLLTALLLPLLALLLHSGAGESQRAPSL
jgi:hypothetical protein